MRNGLWCLGVILGLVGVCFGAEEEAGGLEAYCLMIEPRFEVAEVSSDIPGSERTQLVAGREVDGGMVYYTRAEYEGLGVDWLGYVAKARASAGRLLASLEPEYERDHRGVVKYAVLRSESHRTAGVVLAPGFRERFREVLGEELIVLIPDRFTIFVFSKLASDYDAHGEAVVEQYGDATYGVSVEVFEVDDQGLRVIGRFGDE
ncbi:MAG: hypothetical protein AAF591_05010 [Verrucomicrobiota bacterium]